jgi:integrase/recombinase XerD
MPRPRVLTAPQTQAILDACSRLRDRLLFAVLLDTGMRIGEALGLRHEDLGIAERQVVVMPRLNDNRARVKAGRSRVIPASAELMRLYADYLNREYGALDSDYVFVNLWTARSGIRCAIRRSMTWSDGCGGAPVSSLARTISGTPTPPGCCVEAPGWKA